ncbi:MAG: universal stress protein, partial [Candidatus Promineifilaceae bacterium]
GRYQDFTRQFLPKAESDQQRWAGVAATVIDMRGWPPIEVYQLGNGYFVLDGNHRVSVARQLGNETISAYVTEIKTRVPFSAEDDPTEFITKAQYASFLSQTNLDQLHPEADLLMTVPGHYATLLEQITCGDNDLNDAQVGKWYTDVFCPVIDIMRDLGVMRRFPQRTETDVYVLLSEERDALEKALGWEIGLDEALPSLVDEATQAPRPILSRVAAAVSPDLSDAPPVGTWRTRQLAMNRSKRLFSDLLILFEGIEGDWKLLEGAIKFASRDKDRLLAFYPVRYPSAETQAKANAIRTRFLTQCHAAGLHGEFATEVGNPIELTLKRAAWADMLVINLTHPPESSILARLNSFWGAIIERSPRPLLAVPHANYRPMAHILLAFDGSPKAEEALFLATYNATRWGSKLSVLTVKTSYTPASALDKARTYLNSHQVDNADYFLRDGEIGPNIIQLAAERQCDVIFSGGFGRRPMQRWLRGSSVEYILQHSDLPILLCR